MNETTPASIPDQSTRIASSSAMRIALYEKFQTRISMNPVLDRTLVSFQGNKHTPFSSWFKYREGFSEALVSYLLKQLKPESGILLDPFSGAGSALFCASTIDWQTEGIEVLPVGIHATKARIVASRMNAGEVSTIIAQLKQVDFAAYFDQQYALNHIAITRGAFPLEEEKQLIGYRAYCHSHIDNVDMRVLLLYAAFCILEEISYTRKDGQYLRWDARSGRSQGKRPFNKGRILTFREAIFQKLEQISISLKEETLQQELFQDDIVPGPEPFIHEIELSEGSCLEILPLKNPNSIDFVMTSPPYANRYDYTRTYALELVYLGCNEEKVKQLRQAMLSCTVENKEKRAQLLNQYASIGQKHTFHQIEAVFNSQAALQEVLAALEEYRRNGQLNNENIARLVHNYFYEMCFVIYELSRLLKPGGIVAMVNDNVRYAGEEVPVDIILSDMAESFGLRVRHIWTLGRGKGNSSQQMGNHGRTELRKCVYVWEKPE
ncbi:MAG: site-specific DNA-methyltransferase [Ktedonobacteraceae bacterium]